MMDKRSLMQKIYELGFAMDDMALYLDTHPKDKRALNYYHELHEQYRMVWKEYNDNCAPLTDKTVMNPNYWDWNTNRMPWEGGC